jgi:hypothetical protein
MKRLGLVAVLLSLALSTPASGQSLNYKYFYHGCSVWSCHWASITDFQYGIVPAPLDYDGGSGGVAWWAWGAFSFNVFGHREGLVPGDVLGGTYYVDHYFGPGAVVTNLGYSADYYYISHTEMALLRKVGPSPWSPPMQLEISLLHGPAGPFSDGYELSGETVRLDLIHVAVPEPGIVLLLATGLIGLAALAHHRRRRFGVD